MGGPKAKGQTNVHMRAQEGQEGKDMSRRQDKTCVCVCVTFGVTGIQLDFIAGGTETDFLELGRCALICL